MVYTDTYDSPLGLITLACDGESLVGLWFCGQKHFGKGNLQNTVAAGTASGSMAVFRMAKEWLKTYFSGSDPGCPPPLRYGDTAFRKTIGDILLTIPYGHTMTYGEIALLAAKKLDRGAMSAQAVGGAVGHNPISLMIPCHRVVGTDGSLVGYGGGMERKWALLQLEKADMQKLWIPRSRTAIEKAGVGE